MEAKPITKEKLIKRLVDVGFEIQSSGTGAYTCRREITNTVSWLVKVQEENGGFYVDWLNEYLFDPNQRRYLAFNHVDGYFNESGLPEEEHSTMLKVWYSYNREGKTIKGTFSKALGKITYISPE